MDFWWPLLTTLGLISCVGTITGGHTLYLDLCSFWDHRGFAGGTLASWKWSFGWLRYCCQNPSPLTLYVPVVIVKCIIQHPFRWHVTWIYVLTDVSPEHYWNITVKITPSSGDIKEVWCCHCKQCDLVPWKGKPHIRLTGPVIPGVAGEGKKPYLR